MKGFRIGIPEQQSKPHALRARGTVADILTHVKRPKTTLLVTNRVPVAPFGPKLSQNESYRLQEPFKKPPGPP